MANHRRSGETERHWRGVILEQAASGLSVRAFCRRRWLSEPSFYSWQRELQRRGAAVGDSSPRQETAVTRRQQAADVSDGRPSLVPVTVVAVDVCLEVVLPSGIVLRVPEGITPQTLRDVLAALEPAAC